MDTRPDGFVKVFCIGSTQPTKWSVEKFDFTENTESKALEAFVTSSALFAEAFANLYLSALCKEKVNAGKNF